MSRSLWLLAAVVAVAGFCLAAPALAGAATFSNADPITINGATGQCGNGTRVTGKATPYPSQIDVSGLGTVSDVNVTLTGVSHTWSDDVGVLLVGPGGQSTILMADSGGSDDMNGLNLTFDDAAAGSLPDFSQIAGGTYAPTVGTTQIGSTVGGCPHEFPAPAPAGPYGSALSEFNGTDPNGTWSLYVTDDTAGDVGQISGGWSLEITAATYDFTGFFQPVDNLPVVNTVKAGQAIPIKFSLGGDQGLDIFASGYPTSEQIACDSGASLDGIESTVTAGGSSLTYDALTDTYTYVWKTEKAWANTCRQFNLGLSDGSSHSAVFQFKK